MKNAYKLAKQASLAVVAALASSAVLNAQTNQAQIGGTIRPALQVMRINKASSLIGADVKNQQGVGLGKIRDVVFDLKSGRVAYAVLDSGAGTVNPQKLHAVPLGAFEAAADEKSLILNVDRQKLVQSQGFDENHWPSVTTAPWGGEPLWKDAQGSTDAEKRRLKEQKDKQSKDLEDAIKKTP